MAVPVELVKKYLPGDEFPPTSKLILLGIFTTAFQKCGNEDSIRAFINVLQNHEYFPESDDITPEGIQYSTFKANLIAGLENALRERFPITTK